jgi:hypothetical protein
LEFSEQLQLDISDYKKFPNRALTASEAPFRFYEASVQKSPKEIEYKLRILANYFDSNIKSILIDSELSEKYMVFKQLSQSQF